MTMIANHRCPNCGGNVYLENGEDGWEEACLLCWYRKQISTTNFVYRSSSPEVIRKAKLENR